MFKEVNLDHLLFGTLHYDTAAEDEKIITYGDEVVEKFYYLLEGEVSVWVPEPVLFHDEAATDPANLAYYLVHKYESICWKKMNNGNQIQDFLLKQLGKLKISSYAGFDKTAALFALKKQIDVDKGFSL